MNGTFVADLPKHLGEEVVLHGWVTSVRKSRTMLFVHVRDRSGTVQVTVPAGGPLSAIVQDVTPESAVRVIGGVREDARAGGVEIGATAFEVLARADSPSPLVTNPGIDARMDHRHLDLRSPERFLVFEVQTTFEAAVRELLAQRRFAEIHSPKICAGGSESGAEVFGLPYFDERAYLIQSTQFYKQMAMAAGFDRIFEIGPIFRAERTQTNRHATEFTCIDFEMSWIDSDDDLMAFEEELLRYALGVVRDMHGDDIERCFGVAVEVPEDPIPRVPMSVAQELARDVSGRDRLAHTVEQLVCRYAKETYGTSFAFVTHFPAADRPFYVMRQEPGSPYTRSFDLLWRGIEVTTGGQREHRYDIVKVQAAEAGLSPVLMATYLDPYFIDMFRWGCPPHGGFGIGLNRFLMALLAQPSVRDTSFVYRSPTRLVP
jgi:aspartyl/asparaginyl-tRNA synthetase